MTNQQEVIDTLAAKLRGVPGLVDAMGGDPAAISAYGETGAPPARSVADAIKQMATPSMLLALLSITVDTRWRWHFELYLHAEPVIEGYGDVASYTEIFHRFVEGISEGDDIRLYDAELHANFDPMENVSLERAVADDGLEYWYIRFDLSEIGG